MNPTASFLQFQKFKVTPLRHLACVLFAVAASSPAFAQAPMAFPCPVIKFVMPYPMFGAGRFMRTGKDRVQVESVITTVAIGAGRVAARNIVVADANGVVVVPRHRAREVAQTARQIEAIETHIREQIAQGKTLSEARAALSYHQLQTKA